MDNPEISTEKKKEFAKEQIRFLKEKGLKDKNHISRIFRCAGPGQIQEAWKLANNEDWGTPIGEARKDLLDCIITGYRGSQYFDSERMRTVLQISGFYVPNCPHEKAFFRALDGALEILIPGSYDFEADEDDTESEKE